MCEKHRESWNLAEIVPCVILITTSDTQSVCTVKAHHPLYFSSCQPVIHPRFHVLVDDCARWASGPLLGLGLWMVALN
jgi:hypothetical protein